MLRHFAEGAFSSRHLNLLNLHIGIVNFSQYLRIVFSGAFLLQLGFSIPAVCALMGANIGGRWIFRIPLTVIPHLYGSKAALLVGQLILGVGLFAFSQAKGADLWLWTALALSAAGEALYWHAVHTTFATLSEQGKFGRQLAARSLFMGAGGLLAPFLATAIEGYTGWPAVYLLAAGTVALSFIPLFFMPDPCPPRPLDVRHGLGISKGGMKLFAGWGALSAVTNVIWPLVIFTGFGSFTRFGWLMGVTTLASFLVTIFVARRIDLGQGHGAVRWGCFVYIAIVLSLAAFGRSEAAIIGLTVALTLAGSAFNQPFGTTMYRWAKQTNDPLWFHFWAEMGWDLGNAAVLFTAALILWQHPALDLRWLMGAALPAVAWMYLIYRNDRLNIKASG